MSASVNILTLSEVSQEIGEIGLKEVLSSFSCPLNPEVKAFLKDEKKAIQSNAMSSSVTYLALDSETGDLLRYFTVMMKAYSVKVSELNSSNRRLVERCSGIDVAGNATVPVYLIAQLGKNFSIPESRQIEGAELLDLAISCFSKAKKIIGGKLIMIEREADKPKLLEFYKNNAFKSWTTRRNEKDGIVYDQMFLVLNDE